MRAHKAGLVLLLLLGVGGPSCGRLTESTEQPVADGDGKGDGYLATLPAADTGEGIAGVKRWARDRLRVAESAFRDQGGSRMASPATWASAVTYQIQVDRFNNGDVSNDERNVSRWQRDHQRGDQRGLDDYHHGGDLQGIINRLDYLAHLGVNTLWLTPVLYGNGSYHGYCTTDFTRVDPNFGNAETLRTLTREAHRRGIRVVLDIVVNHMCSNDSHYDDQATPYTEWAYGMCTSDLERKRQQGGDQVRGQRALRFGPTFFPPLRHPQFFSRCGYKPHDFAGFGPGALFGDFSDKMLDFNTMNWDLQDIFTDLHKYWVAYADIDGFRVDAAKHVTEDFLAKLSTDIRAYAASLGKHNFLLVGEVAASTYEQAARAGKMRANIYDPADRSAQVPETLRSRLKTLRSSYLEHTSAPYPGLNAVYDFGHSGGAVDLFHGQRAPLDIKRWFYDGGELDHDRCSSSYCELLFNMQPALNWNVLEIHDWPRFSQIEFDADRSRVKAKLSGALGYLLAAQGAPVLYYGVEQGLDGNCPSDDRVRVPAAAFGGVKHVCSTFEHTRFRQDMFVSGPWRLRSLVPSVDALAHVGYGDQRPQPASWQSDPYLDRGHDLYRYTRRLIAIRKSCRALQDGQTYFRAAHGAPGGLLAFSRIADGRELVVIVNTGGQAAPIAMLHVDADLHRGRDFARYRNLLNGNEQATIGALGSGMGLYFASGFRLAPYAVAIFAADDHVASYNADVGAHPCRR